MTVGVFMPADHPWAGRTAIKVRDLEGMPFVLPRARLPDTAGLRAGAGGSRGRAGRGHGSVDPRGRTRDRGCRVRPSARSPISNSAMIRGCVSCRWRMRRHRSTNMSSASTSAGASPSSPISSAVRRAHSRRGRCARSQAPVGRDWGSVAKTTHQLVLDRFHEVGQRRPHPGLDIGFHRHPRHQLLAAETRDLVAAERGAHRKVGRARLRIVVASAET